MHLAKGTYAVIAHLADQGCGHNWPDAGEGQKDRRLRMHLEQLVEAFVEGSQVLGVHPQLLGEQLRRERLPRSGACACPQQVWSEPVDQHRRVGAPAVVLPSTKCCHPGGLDPSHLVGRGIGADELQGDVAVQFRKQVQRRRMVSL
jgi:hypothetical protein